MPNHGSSPAPSARRMRPTVGLKLLLLGLGATLGPVGNASWANAQQAAPTQQAGQAAALARYQQHVKPLLKARCYACHGSLKQEASLRLDTVAAMRQGGDSGPVVRSGNLASPLLARVTAELDAGRMPPEGSPLTADEIEQLRQWIRDGAPAPENEAADADPRAHWAFQPPQRAQVPADADHPVDAFLVQHRKQQGIQPVGPAEKALLLRRLMLDLTGLPPSADQLRAFREDQRPDAYERMVDQLLASPQHGERWARHWMDIWRYTDWYGLGQQLRYSQKHIWRWRDWIIESLNDDLGYDQMLTQMLAADELAPTDPAKLRATGFLARNYFLFNRTTWLDNTIEHTSKAFLGLTMNCTKCHDHKYDPISQRDYYRLRAIFEPHQVRLDPVPGETDLERDGLPRVFDAHPEAVTYLHVRGNDKDPDTSQGIEPGVPEFLASDAFAPESLPLPVAAYRPSLQPFVLRDHVAAARREVQAAAANLAAAEKAVAELLAAGDADLRSADLRSVDPAITNAKETDSQAKSAASPLLDDDFSGPHPEYWEQGPGKWKYANGRLIQSQVGAQRALLRLRNPPPADFVAELRFRITGGEQWRSVGIAFDVQGEREKLVYLSGVSPGSKLQVSYKTGAQHVYPPAGRVDRPVPSQQDLRLELRVRGTLLNVAVDGKHLLAFTLPAAREPGTLQLIAFDAAVEFDAFTLRGLDPKIPLVQPGGKRIPTLAEARAQLAVARAEHDVAAAKLALLPRAFAADAAKLAAEPALAAARQVIAEENSATEAPATEAPATEAPASDNATSQELEETAEGLVVAAARAARVHERATAQLAVCRQEAKLVAAPEGEREKLSEELAAAKANLAKAASRVEQPGKEYPSLNASLKALEGPAETDAQRRAAYPAASTGRRLALARWIADRNNPLTARVAVNHIWTRHFGQPLVESVFDFGRRAEKPPLADLLDWLAVEFMESGWSMRHLHRLIVTSAAYQLQSSQRDADPETVRRDPTNQYYWRRVPVRMESQAIRDSLLSLAGVLDPAVGGPSIDPAKAAGSTRRSIYFLHSRDDQDKFLAMFDDADILRCYRRLESIIPQQSLALANSELSIDMARKLAEKLQRESPTLDDPQFVALAYRTILACEPAAAERDLLLEALRETVRLLAARNHQDPRTRARANIVHALLNHNDFVTIR